MDLLKDIKELITQSLDDTTCIDIFNQYVFVHIEQAEKYYELAQEEEDVNYYSDVVYRAHQAYEGLLRLVYLGFNLGTLGKSTDNLTLHQIEESFIDDGFLGEMTKMEFIYFRRFWRNRSVHQPEQTYDRDEAVLAISHVTAMIYILLNHFFEYALKVTLSMEKLGDNLKNRNHGMLDATIVNHLKEFHKKIDGTFDNNSSQQLIILLKEYLENNIKGIDVISQYKGVDVIGFQPDIIINDNSEVIMVIEVKNDFTEKNMKIGLAQLKDYLFRTDLGKGIIYFWTLDKNVDYLVSVKIARDKEIIIIKPNTFE